MKTDACQRYLANPEAHAAHLDTCEECRGLFSAGAPEGTEPVELGELPLAPWEGASYRPWAMIGLAAGAVLAVSCALFLAGGVSPLTGLRATAGSVFPSIEILQSLAFRVGGALQHVPRDWQIVLGISFFAVNGLLIALLRRAPKGLDV